MTASNNSDITPGFLLKQSPVHQELQLGMLMLQIFKESHFQRVSNQIADSHFAPSLNRGISWPRCHNAPDAIIPPNIIIVVT